MFKKLKHVIKKLFRWWNACVDVCIKEHPVFWLFIFYDDDFWKLRNVCITNPSRRKELLYFSYLQTWNAWIGLGATFEDIPTMPHSFSGIFISHKAYIGKNVTIFQQVTIGSNTISGSKNEGSPRIGNNVYIGCGAKIIGNCKVGDGVRIGANCIITKDVPSNSVCVMRNLEVIQRDFPLDNKWKNVIDFQ